MPTFTLEDGSTIEVPDDAKLEGGLTVDGKPVDATASSLVSSAQLASGAEKRMFEASEKVKAFESASETSKKYERLVELGQELRTSPTREAFVEWSELSGNDPKEAGQQWDQMQEMQETEVTTDNTNYSDTDNSEIAALKAEIAALREEVATTSNFNTSIASKNVDELIAEAIAKNDLLSNPSVKNKEKVAKMIRAEAEDLISKNDAMNVDGLLMAKAAQVVADDLKEMGVAREPVTKEEWINQKVGLGPSAAARGKSEDEKKYVPLSEPGGKEAFRETLSKNWAAAQYDSEHS